MSFVGKSIIVTGATSGIGWATALRFAKLGGNVSLAGRNSNQLEVIAQKCNEIGRTTKALTVETDVTVNVNLENLVKTTVDAYGRLDVLVNAAGIIETGSIEHTSLEQLDRMLNVNVRSIYYLTMLSVPHLVKSKGNIVNVSSIAGSRSFPNVIAYCTSKAAVDQLTCCTALELASKSVRVNSVNPGVIVTDLHRRSGMDEKAYKEFLDRCKDTHALGRPGTAEEVAHAITFLASDEHASFITGENLHVDGGRHAMCPR